MPDSSPRTAHHYCRKHPNVYLKQGNGDDCSAFRDQSQHTPYFCATANNSECPDPDVSDRGLGGTGAATRPTVVAPIPCAGRGGWGGGSTLSMSWRFDRWTRVPGTTKKKQFCAHGTGGEYGGAARTLHSLTDRPKCCPHASIAVRKYFDL